MPATQNKFSYILDTIRGALDDDSTLAVRNTTQLENTISTTKTIVYVNIIDEDVNPVSFEQGHQSEHRKCYIGINGRFTIPSSVVGVADDYYGDVVEKLDAKLDALSATFPITGTSARYNITIHSLQRKHVSGFVDDGSTTGRVQYECVVYYSQGSL